MLQHPAVKDTLRDMSEYVNDIFLEALKLHVQIRSDCEQTCIDKHFK